MTTRVYTDAKRAGDTIRTVAKIIESREHDASKVDPFGARPCRCETIVVHITDGETLGDDIAECATCGWKLTLRELYKDVTPPELI